MINYAQSLPDYCFYELFKESSIVDASKLLLPTTTLSKNCYYGMFNNSSNLINAPELKATALYEGCYAAMFSGCKSLAAAPTLAVQTLAKECYKEMFKGCTSLFTAPALPATTLAEGCYKDMFNGCTLITKAPELNAENLATSCYSNMFQDCTSLCEAANLPATTLVEGCYKEMFKGCTSLKVNEAGSDGTEIFTTPSSLPTNAVTDMFASTIGSFKGTPTTSKTYKYYSIADLMYFQDTDQAEDQEAFLSCLYLPEKVPEGYNMP